MDVGDILDRVWKIKVKRGYKRVRYRSGRDVEPFLILQHNHCGEGEGLNVMLGVWAEPAMNLIKNV